MARTILLRPEETYLVDSPILQRLRYVRQLGVGHYLFPSSGYSRFEHSLGALHSATNIFDRLFDRNAAKPMGVPEAKVEAHRRIVRAAALLHDIGHCVFSHVSERFYAQNPEVKAAQVSISKALQNRVSASETLSILIICSDPFVGLLQASRLCPSDYSPAEFAGRIAECIAGASNKLLPHAYLAEIVNGVIDCDKLDYLARDAQSAGVPISLDVERLYSKLRLTEATTKKGNKAFVLAIEQSGVRALEEMLASRIFLYDKFYYHQKVMAAEELARRALSRLAEAIPDLASPWLCFRWVMTICCSPHQENLLRGLR
ncbi:MAG: HD domain-containing protein [Gemmatimonadetes bacterium]|nr:HD domain-containing protein [Gemmatimonadota bacterium]